jgi:hypothetical protein
VGVVVAVGLPEMLGVGVDVRLVVVFHGRVVVLVRVVAAMCSHWVPCRR